ncbi:MAG TPA: hypothetical protein PKM43_18630 [Verrucomicrobiota bacterium]|nr:hypothetical protein [candidate division Zixibacteria bacterium]HOC00750.1 hypothetical protein [Verrucomicrobiota bacterium]MDD4918409.1 hypothetical protein [candidate division Zixibacteria bacterium]MDM7972431.1 hypothetical protein [candidate division Zixibacteria bacterium]HOY60353.1 hypothetical protein [Verrucomicrobiota bacterium]
MRELARVLGVHVRTVQVWHRDGMSPINPGDRPLLFLGEEVRRFAADRRKRRSCPLRPSEFYCPRCRAARESNLRDLRIEWDGRRMGRDDEFALIKGKCPICDCLLTRFATRKKLLGSVWEAILALRNGRLWGAAGNCVETDLSREGYHAN